jgi:HAMP domain-containing protein
VAAGNTLLSTEPRAGPGALLRSRALDRQHPDRGTLHGEVNPAYIWDVEDEAALEPGTRLIVLDESGGLLFSSFGVGAVPFQVSAEARKGPAGQFTWREGATDYLAAYWSLFLKNKYLTPSWIVVLNRATSDVFAPIADFRRTFILVGLMSLWIVLFLSYRQIRKILEPVDRLQDATRRLALGRLDTRVEVASRDEFEELARSFNQMADQLGRQFDALTMRSEITVALSRGERLEEVLESCLEILVRHLDLAVAGVWLTGADEGSSSNGRSPALRGPPMEPTSASRWGTVRSAGLLWRAAPMPPTRFPRTLGGVIPSGRAATASSPSSAIPS